MTPIGGFASRRHRPARRVSLLVPAIALVVVGAIGCSSLGGHTAAVGPSDRHRSAAGPTSAGSTPSAGTRSATTTTTTVVPSASSVRRRVLLVGDSLMYGAYPALTEVLASHHVQTRFVGLSGTGLLSGQGWWLRGISAQVAEFDPDVVVIEACCNYANREPLYVSAGRPVLPDTQPMFDAWAASAKDAVARARARGAKVYWATTPDAAILVTENFQVRIHRFNAMYAGLGVPLIDWRKAVEPQGTYTVSMKTPFGDVPVRRSDGLHLTGAGDYVVAQATWKAIAADFG